MSKAFLELPMSSEFGVLLMFCVLMSILYMIGLVIYNVYFHPLSSFPGPLLARASPLWFVIHSFRGDLSREILASHDKYGEIIRIAPNELVTVNPEVFKEVYGHRSGPENMKDPGENFESSQAHLSILFADRQKHGFLRKMLSNAFSDKTMRTQEHVLQQYVDKLIQRLKETCDKGGEPQNMVEWYNFTTFDIIGHLAFNESFDCLKESNYHPWVKMIFNSMVYFAYMRALRRIPTFWAVLAMFMPKSVIKKKNASSQMIREKVLRRKQCFPDYTDFMTHLIEAEDKGQLEFQDLLSNAEVLIIAGSETTATLLSGVTYYLLTNPEVYPKLVNEVRSRFDSPGEITVAGVNGLNYMLACLDEALRLYPPAAMHHPRKIATPGGVTVAGNFIPAGMSIGVSKYSAFRSSLNWSYPLEFIPERWLDQRDTRFANDRREVLQPFSYGPRNCIGKNLAYIEMRLILAKILWNFDLELTDECKDWADQLIFTTWQKAPLMVKLRQVNRSGV